MLNHNPQDIDEAEPTDAEQFDELKAQRERDMVSLSHSSRATQHPAHGKSSAWAKRRRP